MNLGGRVIKTVVAVGLAVFIAQQLGLERVSFAGMVAMISVQRSLFSSVFQAYKRIGGVVLGTLIGAIFVFSFGQNPLAVAAATFLVIQISLKLHWEDNIVLITITVLNLMLYSTGEFFNYAGTQLALALIGAISGISLNILFSPYHKKEIDELLSEVDQELRELLFIVLKNMEGPVKYDHSIFIERIALLKDKIEQGRKLSKLLQEEQRYRFVEDTPSERYKTAFVIFAFEADRVEDLDSLSRKVQCCIPQVFPIIKMGRIIIKIQERILKGKTAPYQLFERSMRKKEKDFTDGPLPTDKEEFISQAALLHILSELKKYYRSLRKLSF